MLDHPRTAGRLFGAAIATSLAAAPLAAAPLAAAPSWTIFPSPNVGTGNNELYGLAPISADDVWAVGRYSTPGGYRTLTMHWDGATWSVVPSVDVGTRFNHLGSVAALAPNDVWAVGSISDDNLLYEPMIQHWDGSAWTVVQTPIVVGSSSFLYGVDAVAATDVWAVGYSNVGTAAQLTLAMHWDGTAWSIVQTPNPSANRDILWSVEAVAADDVWAVGNSSDGSITGSLITHWDGTAWSAVSSPVPDGSNYNFVWGIESASPTDVLAFGRTYDGSQYPALIQRWNGAAWTLDTHPDQEFYNELYAAKALAPDDIWAVGRHGDGFSNNFELITHWDGTGWTIVPSPTPDGTATNFLYAIDAASPDDIWAVGSHQQGFTFRSLIMRRTEVVSAAESTPAPEPHVLALSPNPARAGTTVRFSLPLSGPVRLTMFDPAGRVARTPVDRRYFSPGPHEISLATRGLSGIYFVRLESPAGIATSKLHVVH